MRIVVYPGSFDPPTRGHVDVVERAAKLFDMIYVAVVENPEKKPMFSAQERVEMFRASLKHISVAKVESFQGLLVDYAGKREACAVIRGLRAISDFDYEFQMALTNRQMSPRIETVFLMPSAEYTFLSSSLVRQIAGLGGEIEKLVPEPVLRKLMASKQSR